MGRLQNINLPSILDLECHLIQYPNNKELTSSMLRDLRSRFESILQPDTPQFNPLPAAACLLDPQLAPILLSAELQPLFSASKMYIVSLSDKVPAASECDVGSEQLKSQALGRFKFLAAKIQMRAQATGTVASDNLDTVLGQVNRYVGELPDAQCSNALEFWHGRRNAFSRLALLAEDLLAAPASQAFVERIFSLCGMLSAGRRNRMHRSLEMRVFLKLNASVV
jgi:hypothetical protein